MKRLLISTALVLSVTSTAANARLTDLAEKGLAATLLYAEQCDKNDIPFQALIMAKNYEKNYHYEIQTRIQEIKNGLETTGFSLKGAMSMWCAIMKSEVQKNFSEFWRSSIPMSALGQKR